MRVAVINNLHAVGARAIAGMLVDLGFRCYAAGRSFQKAVMAHTGGQLWGPTCAGTMELGHMPKNALFVDAYPHTEQRFRRAGIPNPLLIFWIEPRGPEAIKSWRPGGSTGVLAQCPRVGAALEGTAIPSSFFWAPYPDPLKRNPREGFGPEVVMVLHNAANWVGKSLNALKQAEFPFALYGKANGAWGQKIAHDELIRRIRHARCLLHTKSFDTPGYALLEAALQGVPPILTPTFLRKTGTEDVWEDGETCVLLKDTTYPSIRDAVVRLGDTERNLAIGRNAQERLEKLSDWTVNRSKLEALLSKIGAM